MWLDIYKQEERILTIKLNSEKRVQSLGRGEECDIILYDPRISRIEGYFKFQNQNWRYEDASGKNQRILKLNEISHLTPIYQIALRDQIKKNEVKSSTAISTKETTKVISLDKEYQNITLAHGFVCFNHPNGSEQKVAIPEEGLTIGSHNSNALCIPSDELSDFHARIDFKNNEYIISDLNSTNGTTCKGLKVIKAALPESMPLILGRFPLQFILETEQKKLKPKKENSFFGMVSKNLAMKKLFTMTEVVASTSASVVIHGESGTGKELLAKAIHDLSLVSSGPFVPLNCASIPSELIESELFGHEKGAFTGALKDHIGAFEAAHGGTLFMDEIGELELSAQAKLLRALESGEIRKLGTTKAQKVNVRIVAASHRHLRSLVKEGAFREDLFYRLYQVPLEIPALKDRSEDLELLVPHLLKSLKISSTLNAKAMKKISEYPFPGNIRELKNILQRAHVESLISMKSKKGIIDADDIKLPEFKRSKFTLDEMRSEREQLVELLERHHHNRSQTARALGVPISTLHDRIKRLQIAVKRSS